MELLKNSKMGIAMVLLGVLGLVLDFATFFEITGVLKTILQAVNTLLLAMGLRDILLNEKQKILKAIADWRSQTFWGHLIAALGPLFINPHTLPGLSPTLAAGIQIVGFILLTFGLIDAGKRGKFITKKGV